MRVNIMQQQYQAIYDNDQIQQLTEKPPIKSAQIIDAELLEMMNDPEYQAEILKMDAEFDLASWEAFQLAESQ